MNLLILVFIHGVGDALVWGTELDDEIRAGISSYAGPIGVGRSYTTSADGHILFWDWSGNLINAVATYGASTDEFNDILINGDSLTSVGFTYAFGAPDGFVARTDTWGNASWLLAIGGQEADQFEAVCDKYICGRTRSWGSGEDDIFLVKTNGNTLDWSLAIGGSGFDYARDIVMLDDDAVVVGSTESYGNLGQVLVMRVSSEGSIEWCKIIGGTGYDMGLVATLLDDNIIVAGKDGSTGGGILLLRIEPDGNLVWSRLIRATGYELPLGMLASEGAIYISGKHTIGGPAFLLKVMADGSLVWDKYIGGTTSDGISSVLETSGQTIAVGYTSSFGFGRRDFFFASVDPWGYNCLSQDASFTSAEISLSIEDTIPNLAFIEPQITFLPNTMNSVSLSGELLCQGVSIEESSGPYPQQTGFYDCAGRRLISEPKRPGVYFRLGPKGEMWRFILR